MTFKFEKDCFDTIEEDYRHVPGKERVDTLLAKINCSQLDAAVTYISMDDGLSADFEAAVNTLATRVAKVFPSAELKGQKRNISEVNSQPNNGGRGRGRFQRGGRAGRGGGRFNNTNNFGTNINGVDVTDPTRQFTSDEWAKIRQANAVNYYLRNLSKQRNGNRGRGCGNAFGSGRGQNQGGARNNSEVNVSSVSNVEPGSATTAIMDDTTTIINNDRGGQNGSNFGPASYNNGGKNVRFASQVTTSTRRAVHLTTTNGKNESKHRNNMPAPNTTGRCEIDNHADTCCLGQNFLPLYFTGKVCEVGGYLDTLPTQTGVEICSGITAVDFQDGETILLVINEGLWYGDRMEHSLLNPNQIRAYGNMICDDPTDPHRALEITLVNENLIIPLTMRGTICGFMSRVPTEEEARTLPRYALTSDTEWDPKEVRFKDSEDQDYWANVSALMTVSDSTESRHRKPNISAEELARLWNIGLEPAKQTLRVTTQAGIRYASQPLTRRYRTERPAMHHRRLFDVFYTDTLFSNIKSLRGARCAQIIRNNKFIKIYPNQSKKMAPSEGLQAFIDDIGIPSEMVFDGLKEQIGHGSDFQELLRTYKVKWNIIEPYTGKQNRAEPQIANLRRRWKLKMQQKGVPARLWDYANFATDI